MTIEGAPGYPNHDPMWVPHDQAEEDERVQRHVGMFEDLLTVDPLLLDSSGRESTAVTKIYFDRLIDHESLQSLSPYNYEGFLERVDVVDGTPVVVVSHLRTYLFSQGDDPGADEPEVELLIAEDELVHVPIREISELFAAQGTPGGWEAHAKGRIDNGEEPDSKT